MLFALLIYNFLPKIENIPKQMLFALLIYNFLPKIENIPKQMLFALLIYNFLPKIELNIGFIINNIDKLYMNKIHMETNNTNDTIGSRFLYKYPDRIPVIVHYDKDIVFTDKENNKMNKFSVPSDMSIGYLLFVIRRGTDISHIESLSILVNDTLPAMSTLLGTVYAKHKNIEDDCLHVHITKENTFG